MVRVVGRDRGQPRRRVQAVELRHHDVHEDHVGAVRLAEVQRLAAVARLGDDLDAVERLHQGADPRTEQGMVVGQQDADRLGHRLAPFTPVLAMGGRCAMGNQTRMLVP